MRRFAFPLQKALDGARSSPPILYPCCSGRSSAPCSQRRTMKIVRILSLSVALLLAMAGMVVAQDTTTTTTDQGAKSDMKDAGGDMKDAGKDVGKGVGKGAKKTGH